MDTGFIIFGAILIISSIAGISFSLREQKIVPIGLAEIGLFVGCMLLNHGWHGINAQFHRKHVAIFTDLSNEGFDVADNMVFARNGPVFNGTEVDLIDGSCRLPFIVTNINGVWQPTLAAAQGKKLIVVKPPNLNHQGACS